MARRNRRKNREDRVELPAPACLDWVLWRPILADPPLATLQDLRTIYSLADLLEFHVVLDFLEDLQAKAQSEARRRAQKTNGTTRNSS